MKRLIPRGVKVPALKHPWKEKHRHDSMHENTVTTDRPRIGINPERLSEEPDVGNLLVRFCEGLGYNWCMAEILWHRRETRRQTANTNFSLQHRESPVYSTKSQMNCNSFPFHGLWHA